MMLIPTKIILYGPNHMYNGFMDYFYAGTGYFNSFGLNNYYLKSTLKFTPNSILQANVHSFMFSGDNMEYIKNVAEPKNLQA